MSVPSVVFDGTNDWLSKAAGLTGAADSQDIIMSVWIKPGADGSTMRIWGNNNLTPKLFLDRSSANAIQVGARRAADNTVCRNNISTITDVTVANGFRHVLVSWTSSSFWLYVDDVDVSEASPTHTGEAADLTAPPDEIGVGDGDGGSGGPSFKLNAEIAELYINYGASLDLSVTNNRRKFITASLKPVYLGSDGSLPTGSQPILYLSNPASTFHVNRGSGGDFTVTGTLTDGSGISQLSDTIFQRPTRFFTRRF